MGALRTFPAILALLALGACTTWPPPGRGGFAEHRPAPPPAGTDDALARRLACALARFDMISDRAEASRLLTGRVAEANETAIRARREVQAGMQADAALTIDRLEAATASIAVQLPGGPRATPPECL